MKLETAVRRLDRERRARESAEKLLRDKSAELYEYRQTLELGLWASQESIWKWDLASSQCSVTRFDKNRRQHNELLFSDDLKSLIHPDDVHEVFEQVEEHTKGYIPMIDLACRFQIEEKWVWLRIRGQATQRNTQGIATLIIGTSRDISVQQEQLKQLDQLARFDMLTGLLNRRTMQESLVRLTSGKHKFCLLFIDLDGFKLLNDTQGHGAGDKYLKYIADFISDMLPATSLISRFGGDEFLCAFDYHGDWQATVEKLLVPQTQNAGNIGNYSTIVTLSIGVALYPEHSTDPDSLIEFADSAMYQAKRKGKNQFIEYSPDIHIANKQQINLLTELKHDIDEQRLHFAYQLKFDHAMQPKGVEVLCRWDSKTYGKISPGVFIPLAMEHGMIRKVTRLALQSAVDAYNKLQECGYDLTLAVNVSSEDILSDEFQDELLALVHGANVPVSSMELEVTEAVFLDNVNKASTHLRKLREAGFKLAMDDFGTGYSSLSYISQYQFDSIKIDQSFVQKMEDSQAELLVVEAIVNLCKTLGIALVAEGIENKRQYSMLKSLGVEQFQGFYLAKPKSFSSLLEHLSKPEKRMA